MQVGELAGLAGVSVRSIRYYEQAGLLEATRRPNGYREFDPAVVERVVAIRDLLESGFNIEEIVSLSSCLQGAGAGPRCREQTIALYRSKLEKIETQVETLNQLRKRIAERIATLEPRGENARSRQ